LFQLFRIDFAPTKAPKARGVVVATILSVIGSLLADVVLVKIGVHLFPAQKNYQHFQFSDYAKLTTVGVLFAGIGWPLVARLSSTAQSAYARLAIVVTLVLLAPDAAIWYLGQPADGVFVLVWMHLAIGVVTYFVMTRVAALPRGRHSK
jgi:hypothetical protein